MKLKIKTFSEETAEEHAERLSKIRETYKNKRFL